jgi:predicted O-methyltransferase YrrM
MENPRETFWKTILPQTGHFVEIGTCFGTFSDFLLKNTRNTRLTTIDPYRKFPGQEYRDALNNYSQEQCDHKYLHTYTKLKMAHGDRVTMLRSLSVDAAQVFENDSLDLVYIDANHEFKAVVADIMAWLPKVKKGGILGGDDVEDITKHHDGNNLYVEHAPGSFGYYGVHAALVYIKKHHAWFDYKIVGNQWYWVKN